MDNVEITGMVLAGFELATLQLQGRHHIHGSTEAPQLDISYLPANGLVISYLTIILAIKMHFLSSKNAKLYSRLVST